MTKKQFILDTLLPYKEDSSLCGYEDGRCKLLTRTGNKCAFGKHLTKGWVNKLSNDSNIASGLLKKHGNKILTKKAREMNFSPELWDSIQQYHDNIARFDNPNIRNVRWIEKIANIKLPELYPDERY